MSRLYSKESELSKQLRDFLLQYSYMDVKEDTTYNDILDVPATFYKESFRSFGATSAEDGLFLLTKYIADDLGDSWLDSILAISILRPNMFECNPIDYAFMTKGFTDKELYAGITNKPLNADFVSEYIQVYFSNSNVDGKVSLAILNRYNVCDVDHLSTYETDGRNVNISLLYDSYISQYKATSINCFKLLARCTVISYYGITFNTKDDLLDALFNNKDVSIIVKCKQAIKTKIEVESYSILEEVRAALNERINVSYLANGLVFALMTQESRLGDYILDVVNVSNHVYLKTVRNNCSYKYVYMGDDVDNLGWYKSHFSKCFRSEYEKLKRYYKDIPDDINEFLSKVVYTFSLQPKVTPTKTIEYTLPAEVYFIDDKISVIGIVVEYNTQDATFNNIENDFVQDDSQLSNYIKDSILLSPIVQFAGINKDNLEFSSPYQIDDNLLYLRYVIK